MARNSTETDSERSLGTIIKELTEDITTLFRGEIALLARLHGIASPFNVLLQTAANDAARRKLPPKSIRASDLLKGAGY